MPIAPEYLHMVFPGVEFHAWLYGRNSVDPQGKGRSVKDQLTTGRSLCNKFSWHIADTFKDTGISASRHGRKTRDDFEELLDVIETCATPPGVMRILVAFEASRYYRDLEAYVRLRNRCYEAGVLLCYNGQVYDLSKKEDRKATALDALQAESEAEDIRDRNLRTVQLNAEAGRPHGKHTFGYARRYDQDTGDLIEQYEHPVHGKVVVEAARRIDKGDTLYSVVQWLNTSPDARRPDEAEWTNRLVKYMLMNPAYLGQRVYRGTVSGKASWPALKGLDTPEGVALFNRVRKRLKERAQAFERDTELKYLLSNIALCGECGDHARLIKGKYPNGTWCYRCVTGKDTSLRLEPFDAYVTQGVLSWLRKPEAREALMPSQGNLSEQLAEAQGLIDAYEEQLTEARALSRKFKDGRPLLSVASLSGMEQDLLPLIEAEKRKLDSVTGISPLVLRLLNAKDPAEVWDGDGRPGQPALTLPQKREVIRRVVTVRLFSARAKGVRRIEPGRITLSYVGEPGFRGAQPRARGTARAQGRGPAAPGTE